MKPVVLGVLVLAGVFLIASVHWMGGLTGELTQVSPLCRDSDGNDFYYHGKVLAKLGSQSGKIFSDYCGTSGIETGQLIEYLCAPDNTARKVIFDCPNGCYGGRCQEIPMSAIGNKLR